RTRAEPKSAVSRIWLTNGVLSIDAATGEMPRVALMLLCRSCLIAIVPPVDAIANGAVRHDSRHASLSTRTGQRAALSDGASRAPSPSMKLTNPVWSALAYRSFRIRTRTPPALRGLPPTRRAFIFDRLPY